MVVVQNDPLLVEVNLKPEVAHLLKVGDKLQTSYKAKEWGGGREAAVSYIAPSADAGAGLQTVHLELPNPDNKDDSGLQIYVQLPASVVAAAQAAAK